MNAVVEQALAHWGLEGGPYELIAARENSVFKIDCPSGRVALRLRRKGYRTDAELRSELEWMAAVGNGGIRVPTPITGLDGALLHIVGGVHVDVLSWLDGIPVKDTLDNCSPEERATLFEKLGRVTARLHAICDAWTKPDDFTRWAWDAEGLLGDAPLWGRFWENQTLTPDDKSLFLSFREHARGELSRASDELDYGLIHADLVSENIIVKGDMLSVIDFDDGGFGYRLFDLATALLKFHTAEDYTALRAALVAGYRGTRAIDDRKLDLFLALRAVTYVGWNMTRANEAGGEARNARFIDTARMMISACMVEAERQDLIEC